MPQLIATHMDDKVAGSPTLTRVVTGYTGTRYFRVNTRDPALALTATGLPTINETPYSPLLPNVFCTQLGPSEVMGGTDDGSGTGGWTRVQALYATPGLDGSLIPPRAGLAYTLWNPSVGSITRFWDIRARRDGSSGPFEKKINNGQGVTVEVGMVEVQVVIYPPDIPGDVLARINDLAAQCKTNTDQVQLPPVHGTSFVPLMSPGSLRYRTFEIGSDANLLKLTHRMAAAPSFWISDGDENADGRVINERQVYVYHSAPFDGIW